MVQPIVISVDGLIGAGKTALCELLENKLAENIVQYVKTSKDTLPMTALVEHAKINDVKVCMIKEPVKCWRETGALTRFYADVKNRAYEFQSFVYCTRITAILEAVKAFHKKYGRDADVYILERSVFSDEYLFVEMLHRDGMFDDDQLKMYRKWSRMWDLLLPWFPSGFVYLSPSIDETMRRIEIRARSGETVSLNYQSNLLQRHEEVFGNNTVHIAHRIGSDHGDSGDYPVHQIRTNDDFRLENGGHKEIVYGVTKFIMSI